MSILGMWGNHPTHLSIISLPRTTSARLPVPIGLVLYTGGARMSAEENKAIVHRYYEEVWNQGNLAVVDELYAPTFILNGQTIDCDQQKQSIAGARAAMHDGTLTFEDIIAEGDKVVSGWTWRGRHRGEWASSIGRIPPTGKQVTLTGISIHRVEGGRIVEDWFNADELGLLHQLGVIPSPGQAS